MTSTSATYDPTWPLREARARYFEDNGFGADGGYDARWVKLAIGPVPFAFPNTQARVRAVRYHDLHHVLTGYRTDLIGESEIGAWELASGCRGFGAAWVLNLSALGLGLLVNPARMRRAFVRGRHTRNLYGHAFDDALLDQRVGDMRAALGLDAPVPEATPADRRAFLGYGALGLLLLALQTGLVLAPLAALLWWLLA